mmetsp:Transcript_27991/g.47583  ORF Transcript_27991/g.47583 Transcript_27991/m.47583 type:complete len:409 (-) Transcript_27991:15-1241(-)
MPCTDPSTLTRTPSLEQSKRKTVPWIAWPPIFFTPSIIRDSNSAISDGEPLYLGFTLSAIALAIFSAPTLYTISNTNEVISDKDPNVLAACPIDPEDTASRTAADEYMATAYTLIMDFFLTPAPTRYKPSSSLGAKEMPVAYSCKGFSLASSFVRLASGFVRSAEESSRISCSFPPPFSISSAGTDLAKSISDLASILDSSLDQILTQLSTSVGLTALASVNTSTKALPNPSNATMPCTDPSTLTRTPSLEQSKRKTVPWIAWPPIFFTPSIIRDSNSAISDGEPLYLGFTLSAIALAIFSAPTLYTISNTNEVISDKDPNVLAACPIDPEDTASRTAADEYMATAYTLIMDFFLTPAPTRYKPSSSLGAKVMPVAASFCGCILDSTARNAAFFCFNCSSFLPISSSI